MIHNQYEVDYNNKKRRLGILAETHLYRPEEVDLARHVIRQYDLVISEGGFATSMAGVAELVGQLLFGHGASEILDQLRRYFYNRVPFNFERAVKQENKDFMYAQDLTLKCTLGSYVHRILTTLNLPLQIFNTFRDGSHGDPFTIGSLAYYDRTSKIIGEDGFILRLPVIVEALYDLKRRDEIIADATLGQLNWHERVLVRCGWAHGLGVKRNLEARLGHLSKIKVEKPKYKSSINPRS